MSLKVIGFYRKNKNKNSFTNSLVDPIFYILVSRNKKIKEYTIKFAGKMTCLQPCGSSIFDPGAFRNYNLITDFLLGENGGRIRAKWGLTKKEYRDLIFQLYIVLVKNHAKCSVIRKWFLIVAGFIKYKVGGKRA